MSLLGMTLFPLNVQEYKYYINMNINIKRGTVMINSQFSFVFQSSQYCLFLTSLLQHQALSICQNRISLPLLLHQLLIFIALFSLQLINTMLGCTRQQLIFFQNLPLRERVRVQDQPNSNTFLLLLIIKKHFTSSYHVFLYRRRESTMIKTTTFMFSQRTHFHCLNSYHSRI